ncbi:MAG: sugar ABC transporter permease, partial [Bacillota bacterium]
MRDRHTLLQRKITVFGSTYRLEETLWSYILLMPSILVFSVFTFIPVIYSVWLSLHKWNLVDPAKAFVGFSNYISILKSPDFRQAFWNTLYYSLGTIPAGTALALMIAILLNQKIRGLSFYRTVYFLPVVTSMVAVSAVWMWIYHPTYGPLNRFLD